MDPYEKADFIFIPDNKAYIIYILNNEMVLEEIE